MNLDNRENHRQDGQYFQDDETRYENDHRYDDIANDAPTNHPISDNAEPDYEEDLKIDESDGNQFHNDDEFDEEDDLEDFDEENGTSPNRNL